MSRIIKVTRLLSEADGEIVELTQVTKEITPSGGTPVLQHVTIAESAWTEIDLTAFAAIEQAAIENNDAENFVQLALDDQGAQIFCERLAAGDRAVLPGLPTTIYAKANTADVDVTVLATEYVAPEE